MLRDANMVLQASVTKTATFNGASVDLGVGGTPTRGLAAQVVIKAIDSATGDEGYQFKIEESDDDAAWNDLTWFDDLQSAAPADLVTQVLREIFSTRKRYVRLTLVASGTTPSVTYSGDIGVVKPAD